MLHRVEVNNYCRFHVLAERRGVLCGCGQVLASLLRVRPPGSAGGERAREERTDSSEPPTPSSIAQSRGGGDGCLKKILPALAEPVEM